MHAKADEIVALARSLEGVKYRQQGRLVVKDENGVILPDRSRLDCAGVIWYCAHELGLSKYNVTDYGERPDPIRFRNELIRGGATAVKFDELAPGDILLLLEPRWPVHSAIYLGSNSVSGQLEMVHAWLLSRKVCVVPYGRVQEAKLSSIFRYPE